MAREVDAVDWQARSRPAQYHPAQLDGTTFPCVLCGCMDWWHHRSRLCSCCFPLCRRLAAGRGRSTGDLTLFDSTDPTVWKGVLGMPTKCPASMQGVWWMCDNIAAEALLCFHDASWEGTHNAAGTTGVAVTWKPMARSYSRPPTAFGYFLAIYAAWQAPDATSTDPAVIANAARLVFNFDVGKGRMDSADEEWLFRVSEDEWQKCSWASATAPEDKAWYMYRWRRIIRTDGSTTPHFEDYMANVTSPVPHRSACEPWCSCWPVCGCLSGTQCLQDMRCQNRTQMTVFPDPGKVPAHLGGSDQAEDAAPPLQVML